MSAAIKHDPDRWVSPKEACRYGRWSKPKLYRLINAGKVIAIKDVNQTWISLDSIDAYKASLPRVGGSSGESE